MMLEYTLTFLKEYLARNLRDYDRPFGGIQVCTSIARIETHYKLIYSWCYAEIFINCLQFPIVNVRYLLDRFSHLNRSHGGIAFRRPVSCRRYFVRKVTLVCDTVCPKRTSFDIEQLGFIEMLNAMRVGIMSPQIVLEFQKLQRQVHYTDNIEPTDLYVTRRASLLHSVIFKTSYRFPTKREVEAANTSRLEALEGSPRRFVSEDGPGFSSDGQPLPKEIVDKVLEQMVAPKTLVLKVRNPCTIELHITQHVPSRKGLKSCCSR